MYQLCSDALQGFFHVVVFSHILEHVSDVNKTLSEISRVLKDDGFAVLFCPIAYGRKHTYENSECTTRECRMKEFGQYDHVRIVGEDIVNATRAHFPTVAYGAMHNYYKKHHESLARLFRNPEYQEGRETYMFGFKSSKVSWMDGVF